MKIRLKDSYDGPIPKDVLYDAIRVKEGYCIAGDEGRAWSIHKDSVEEIDEFEEEFDRLCEIVSDNVFFGSHREHELGAGKFSVILENQSAQESYCIRKKDIPALILALLKLMEE